MGLSTTIAICTRNRPEELRRAIAAVAAANPAAGELLIIDQSDEMLAIPPPWDRGFRHVRSERRGVAAGRNEALALAAGELVFFTDDDCLLQPNAVEVATAMLQAVPEVAIVFGAVRADRSVRREGFIPTYIPRRRQVLRGRLGKLRDGGIGAFMAVRREAGLAVGGFDERLGPGALLPSCEEGEFAYRVLKQEYAIGHVPEVWVLHEGVKPWADGSRFAYQTFRAVAAAYAMHLRKGDLVAGLLVLQQIGFVLAAMAGQLARGEAPRGLRRLQGILAGTYVGLTLSGGPLAPAGSRDAVLIR